MKSFLDKDVFLEASHDAHCNLDDFLDDLRHENQNSKRAMAEFYAESLETIAFYLRSAQDKDYDSHSFKELIMNRFDRWRERRLKSLEK